MNSTGIGAKSVPSQRYGCIGAVLQGATSLRDPQGRGPPPLQIGLRYDLKEIPLVEFVAQSPILLAIARWTKAVISK